MKVKAADEAKVHIRKRKAFRYNGCRGHKSKSCEGCYGIFALTGTHGQRMTIIVAVYEPQTAKWYTTRTLLNELQKRRLDIPEADIFWMDNNGVGLHSIYREGYAMMVKARIMGEL